MDHANAKKPKKRPIAAVVLDGILAEPQTRIVDPGLFGAPLPKAVIFVEALMKFGFDVLIVTERVNPDAFPAADQGQDHLAQGDGSRWRAKLLQHVESWLLNSEFPVTDDHFAVYKGHGRPIADIHYGAGRDTLPVFTARFGGFEDALQAAADTMEELMPPPAGAVHAGLEGADTLADCVELMSKPEWDAESMRRLGEIADRLGTLRDKLKAKVAADDSRKENKDAR